MVKLIVLAALLSVSVDAMSMIAKSSKTMTVRGPNGAEKMFVEHSATSDLESSASGYIYQSNGEQPATIIKLGEPGYHEPHEFRQLLPHSTYDFPVVHPHPHVAPAHYSHGSGRAHDSSHWSSHGEKGGKGYSGYDKYDESAGKKYDKGHDSGYYDEKEGKKSSHHDEGGSYASFDEGKKGESGESYDHKKSHKKGHKTTGYHNIYHKDEFKKQHSFYDEADGRGHYNKYGSGEESHGLSKGGYKKGDHSDSGFHAHDYGKKGSYDKGAYHSGAKGYKESAGGESHYAKGSEYGGKGGKSFRKEYGYDGESGFDHEH